MPVKRPPLARILSDHNIFFTLGRDNNGGSNAPGAFLVSF